MPRPDYSRSANAIIGAFGDLAQFKERAAIREENRKDRDIRNLALFGGEDPELVQQGAKAFSRLGLMEDKALADFQSKAQISSPN